VEGNVTSLLGGIEGGLNKDSVMKKTFITLIIITATIVASFKFIEDKKLAKVNSNDDYDFISINNILMWVSNNGDGSHDPITHGNGFFWPKDSLSEYPGSHRIKSAIYEDGLVWGGIVDGDIRANGNTHRQGIQAGKILDNGRADDPSLEKYRVYKIRKDWQSLPDGEEKDRYQTDYNEWPVEDGAPWIDVDNDGIFTKGVDQPKHEGDETLWFVSNDLDGARTAFTYGKPPIGLEIQTTVYGFNKPDLDDVVFKKYKIINKGQYYIDSLFFGQWAHPVLGDASNNYAGCDTTLDLLYCWKGYNDDLVYGTSPPAVGYLILQGPYSSSINDSAWFNSRWNSNSKNHDLHAFFLFINSSIYAVPSQGVAEGSMEMYNYLRGLLWNGGREINPHTDQATRYMVSGDPVAQTGWYEGPDGWGYSIPGRRRFVGSMGSVTMAPGDTQEIVIAIPIAQGIDNINSIHKLRILSRRVRTQFHNNFEQLLLPQTQLKATQTDTSVTLYWDDNATSYNKSGYSFEGYQVYQCKNLNGDDPQHLKTIDLDNDLMSIWDYQNINGVQIDALLLKLDNLGLDFIFDITKDVYSGNKLYPGSEYYFYVTSFAYGQDQAPRLIERKSPVIKVIPGSNKPEIHLPFDNKDFIAATQLSGTGDGLIGLDIVDASVLNDHSYKVFFDRIEILDFWNNPKKVLSFNLVDLTVGDTLIHSRPFSAGDRAGYKTDLDTSFAIAGFQFIVQNAGYDNLITSGLESAIKSLEQTKTTNEGELEVPINVAGSLGSNGDWRILGLSEFDQDSVIEDSKGIHKAINWKGKAGLDVFEIRFTTEEEGSEYYLTGYLRTHSATTAAFYNNPKALGKVPFQIWYMGPDVLDTSDDQRLIIKILDESPETFHVKDSTWSQFSSESKHAGKWEAIYAYFPIDSLYPESLPETSGHVYKPLEIHKLGHLVLDGNIPEPGTVVRIDTWEPLSVLDTFVVTATAPTLNDYAGAKKKLDQISVFPNPFFGTDPFGRFPDRNYMRFTDLPQKVIVRIFTLSGQLVKKIEKESDSPWLDWDLRNRDGRAVASGIYIAYLEMPKIGRKVMKLAVVQDNR